MIVSTHILTMYFLCFWQCFLCCIEYLLSTHLVFSTLINDLTIFKILQKKWSFNDFEWSPPPISCSSRPTFTFNVIWQFLRFKIHLLTSFLSDFVKTYFPPILTQWWHQTIQTSQLPKVCYIFIAGVFYFSHKMISRLTLQFLHTGLLYRRTWNHKSLGNLWIVLVPKISSSSTKSDQIWKTFQRWCLDIACTAQSWSPNPPQSLNVSDFIPK